MEITVLEEKAIYIIKSEDNQILVIMHFFIKKVASRVDCVKMEIEKLLKSLHHSIFYLQKYL